MENRGHQANDPRPRRVAMCRARGQLAHTVADVVNVSRTGILVRVSYELRPSSEWPLVLDGPGAAPLALSGRVVRCEPADVSRPGGALLTNYYAIALTFVDPSPDAQAVLDQVCRADQER